jgi:MYXO-CTERM domain-containing protein
VYGLRGGGEISPILEDGSRGCETAPGAGFAGVALIALGLLGRRSRKG